MAAVQAPGDQFAATWRDSEDRVVSTTFGGTLCWYPVKPWRLRISRDGFEHVLRCRECPGCREFERRRLAGRLHTEYTAGTAGGAAAGTGQAARSADTAASTGSRLYMIRIWAPLGEHAALSRALHRSARLHLERGFYRLGTGSIAVLTRTRVCPPLPRALAARAHRVEPIRLSRRRRAWRPLTSGILVSREAYGEQVKRWYCRGLPQAERENWDVVRISDYRPYNRFVSPRAWSAGNLVLVPPEIWMGGRVDRRAFRQLASHATSPESASALASQVAKLAGTVAANLGLTARPKAALEIDHSREVALAMAKELRAKAGAEPTGQSSALPSEGGRYASSDHSSGPDPPPFDQVAGAQRIIELRREGAKEVIAIRQRHHEAVVRRLGYDPAENLDDQLARLRARGVDEETIERLRRAWTRER